MLSPSRRAVSIHLPLAEHDQFTPALSGIVTGRFNSRAPRGARLSVVTTFSGSLLVSIHVPLAEHDSVGILSLLPLQGFNSRAPRGARQENPGQSYAEYSFQFTCPSRSTTDDDAAAGASIEVSIHVPLAEHDVGASVWVESLRVSIHVPLAEHD